MGRFQIICLQSPGLPPPGRSAGSPGLTCSPPASPQCGGLRGRTAPSASARRSHRSGVCLCRRPEEPQLLLCNTWSPQEIQAKHFSQIAMFTSKKRTKIVICGLTLRLLPCSAPVLLCPRSGPWWWSSPAGLSWCWTPRRWWCGCHV